MGTIDPVTAKKLAERIKKLYGKSILLKEDLFGSTPPSVLLTEIKYPKISLGILISEDKNTEIYDNPILWTEKEMSIEDIVKLRVNLINARKITDVLLPRKNSVLYEKILDSMLSVKSIDVEAKIKKIALSDKFSKLLGFYGFKGILKDLQLAENPKIPVITDRMVEEDIKAEEAIKELYIYGFSDYYISRLLSIGALGLKINRKLVPSKWSITAVQSILIKFLYNFIKRFSKTIERVIVFNYKFYGNDFYAIVFPGDGKFELIEAILPGSAYNLHYNFVIMGRDDESGGYYAAKLSFYELLNELGRKANCIIFRIITKEYYMPLGVWVVREGTRRLFKNPIEKFYNLNEALNYIDKKLEKYNISVFKLKTYSNILKQKLLSF